MTAILLATLVIGQKIQLNEAFYAKLLKQRIQFGEVLRWPAEDVGYVQIQSEMLGGACADGFYPVGSAASRYIINFDEGTHGVLMLQARKKNYSYVVWHVPVEAAGTRRKVKGTMRKYLDEIGYMISPKAHVTPYMEKKLTETGYFASFHYHPMRDGLASVVSPDGTFTKPRYTSDPIEIIPEEKALLARLARTNKKKS